MAMNAAHILSQYWGFDGFRPLQQEIITHISSGNNTVALLPTGGGKSLCYQVPALMTDGICIVISPLVALMKDQVQDLKQRGIKAMAISGGLKHQELVDLLDNALFGNFKLLYLSPERLQQEVVQQAIQKLNVNLMAVDEAHCISQWGHDFRPAYRNIQSIKEWHPAVPLLAVTATATPQVLEDILLQLQISEAKIFQTSFVRSNLTYKVLEEHNKLQAMVNLLQPNDKSAVVYVRSRKHAETLSSQLKSHEISSDFFHGGLSTSEKEKRLRLWKNGQITTIVATNAFGMGIDHPQVRFVVHVQLPESLESYFQEAGRAGRDGLPSEAILLYNEEDKRIAKKQFIASTPNITQIKALYKHLSNYFQIAYGEGEESTHSFEFSDFCETYDLNPIVTYNGLETLDRLGIIQLSKQFGRESRMQFLVSSNRLLASFDRQELHGHVGKTILRMYGGIFEVMNKIDLHQIAKKAQMEVDDVISVLREMEEQELIAVQIFESDATITFLVPREDDRTLSQFSSNIKAAKKRKEVQLQSVLDYVENKSSCRSQLLLGYFGQKDSQPCGKCDYCMRENRQEIVPVTISEKIIALLKEKQYHSRQLADALSLDQEELLPVLQMLLDAGKIGYSSTNTLYNIN